MPASIVGTRIAVIGGDQRQLAVAEALDRLGYKVAIYGLPAFRGDERAGSLEEALENAAIIILPIGSIGDNGSLKTMPDQPSIRLDDDFWRKTAGHALILAGIMAEGLKQTAIGAGHKVIEYAEIDEIAVMNSIPTAEGALQLAMENMPITIHGCCCFVLGFGRVGQTTARLFKAVGAETWVFANRPVLRARAHEMGCPSRVFAVLPDVIDLADLIINTVPALVVTRELIKSTKPSVYLVDLASAPGGIDHRAAEELKRRSILALALPGKVAPQTAGKILADALPAIIERELNLRGGGGRWSSME